MEKIKRAIKNAQISERQPKYTAGIFKLEALFIPEQFKMPYYPRIPNAVFNPAAYNVPNTDKVILFPRLVFDDKFYISSIGVCDTISLNDLSSITSITTHLLATPTDTRDFLGLEDARITEDGKKFLHVALDENKHSRTVLSYHESTTHALYDSHYLKLSSSGNEEEILSGRDSAILTDEHLLCRPEFDIRYCFSAAYKNALIDDDLTVALSTIKHTERRCGFSTNAIKLSSNEFLVGWHAILERNLEYMNGFSVVSDTGKPIASSNYLLRAEGFLRYGNRPNTLFGCGLILHDETIYWIGGIGDWSIGIYSAKLEDVLGHIE